MAEALGASGTGFLSHRERFAACAMTLTSQETDLGEREQRGTQVGRESLCLTSYVNPLLCVYTLPSRQADDKENR